MNGLVVWQAASEGLGYISARAQMPLHDCWPSIQPTERTDTRCRSTHAHHPSIMLASILNLCRGTTAISLPCLHIIRSERGSALEFCWNLGETETRSAGTRERVGYARAEAFLAGKDRSRRGRGSNARDPVASSLQKLAGALWLFRSRREERRRSEAKQSWPTATDQQPLDAGRPFAKGRHKCATHAAKEKAQKATGYDKDGRQGDR